MFEKESENYQKEVIAKKDYPHTIAIDWQRGAEFGYNKALEENNKLKEKLKNLESVADFQTSSNMDRYFQLKRSKEKITEAKEIIKKFSEFANNEVEYDPEYPQEHTDLWNKLCEEAEQFLEED